MLSEYYLFGVYLYTTLYPRLYFTFDLTNIWWLGCEVIHTTQ